MLRVPWEWKCEYLNNPFLTEAFNACTCKRRCAVIAASTQVKFNQIVREYRHLGRLKEHLTRSKTYLSSGLTAAKIRKQTIFESHQNWQQHPITTLDSTRRCNIVFSLSFCPPRFSLLPSMILTNSIHLWHQTSDDKLLFCHSSG